MNVSAYAWGISVVVMVGILAVDVFVIGRRPHEPSMTEAGILIAVFATLAVMFGLGVWAFSGPLYAGEFFAGWLTEYSLSFDNLFIFVILMTKLKVPRHLQQFALMVGIIFALVFRGVFIAVGAAAIDQFSWTFFVFGAFLVFTAVRLVVEHGRHGEDKAGEMVENPFTRLFRGRFDAVTDFHGTKLTVVVPPHVRNGRRAATPLLFVVVALGSTDLLFALDSIPAIFGLTQEPYLVFTANVFALMGLRQLYFLIGSFLRKLVYLSLGLSVILGFIGAKLILHALHAYHLADQTSFAGEIPIWVSLTVIVTTLLVTTVASLIKSGLDDAHSTPRSSRSTASEGARHVH